MVWTRTWEYLHADYEPDLDYVDGRLGDRNVGEDDHHFCEPS